MDQPGTAPSQLPVAPTALDVNVNHLPSIEDVVVEWMLRFASLSNVEFAHLSNVSKRWRSASKRAIQQQIMKPCHKRNVGSSLLLLPSMFRYITSSSTNNMSIDEDTFCAAWFHPGGIQELAVSLNSNDLTLISASSDNDVNDQNSYTTSKSITQAFAPHGEAGYDNSDKDEDDTKGDGTRSSRSSRKQLIRQEQSRSKSPAETLSLSMQQQQRSQNHVGATTVSVNSSLLTEEPRIPTCSEWRGYRAAMDVLRHFGYTASFVDDVISSAFESTKKVELTTKSATPNETNYKTSRRFNTPNQSKNGSYRETTYAVRGAIVSRPESYCDCIDNAIDEQLRTLRFANTASMPSGSNNSSSHNELLLNNIRIQECKQSILRKEIRRKELQRDVLPRIITRFPSTRPTQNNTDSILAVSHHSNENGSIYSNFAPNEDHERNENQHHRCVQFLNANGGHAVCMLTPPFACGPLVEPVTILCVGIATEDGCFLSGLNHRFELGHLYPNNAIAEISEQSPVCIATDCSASLTVNCNSSQVTPATVNGQLSVDELYENDNLIPDPPIRIVDYDCHDRDREESDGENDQHKQKHSVSRQDDDDDDDSCDGSYDADCDNANGFRSGKCDCIFNGAGEKIAALDEGTPRIIHRGRLGPGAWHCYVAVFDGENSSIRIDGIPEEMQTEHPDDQTKCDVDTIKTKAMLDGLTIGSDHCFGMSLCCGNGSGGEGEGAIAELAVFKGRLDLLDIKALEKDCMERHNIPPVHLPTVETCDVSETTNSSSMTLWKENEFVRHAHALFFLPEADDDLTTLPLTCSSKVPPRIPLRFLSRHRSVAWKYSNPVTGEPIHIKRIGCKPGASSSDL